MPKAASFFSSLSSPRIFTERSSVPARRSDTSELVAIALLCGMGLFVSLVAVILGI
ncbi:hypothetical protein ABIG06_006978 [Bradyrhizobium sp. USDA 326]|uniref:hypothetical protein n=1 Tax=unclassified Bradyrhizobium TaxID=2631580 RepID=UPI0018F6F325|nr:hypothetical protein [Bradyrhizobium sp. RP6]